MTRRDKKTPPGPDPKPGRNPGYPEPQPRDREDARQPAPGKHENTEEGGLKRESS